MNADRQRKLKAGLSRKMRRLAEARKCPECGRKYALQRDRSAWPTVVSCRYCDYERASEVEPQQRR